MKHVVCKYNTYPFNLICIIKSLIVSDRFWYVIQNGRTYNQVTKRRRGKGKNCGKYKPR